MLKNITSKKLFFVLILIIFDVLAISLYAVFATKPATGPESVLKSLGFNTETTNVTFQNYKAQKISADKGDEHVILEITKNVRKDSSNTILKDLVKPVESIQQNVVITDPYSGSQTELKIPDTLKPTKKEIAMSNSSLTYYVVYVNEIFSLKIFSEKEAKFKGIFTAYYCPEKNTAYRLEIFNNINGFDENSELDLVGNLFCK